MPINENADDVAMAAAFYTGKAASLLRAAATKAEITDRNHPLWQIARDLDASERLIVDAAKVLDAVQG